MLDATRCISYLTIEQKGPIPDALAPKLGGWTFGCDVCNDVCPWNLKFSEPTTVPEYLPQLALDGEGPDLFERMDEPEFQRRFGHTPLSRPGLTGMRRNWRTRFRAAAR